MHIVIINASPRTEKKSNTTTIIRAWLRGYEQGGNTAELYHLSDRRQWEDAKAAFEKNEHILFSLPLYVENIPGIMLEFLEELTPKTEPGTKISFLLQSGFPEACQRRCGEHYLERLPKYFNCEFAGILSRGDMFGINLLGEKIGNKMVQPFEEMGRRFAGTGDFLFPEAKEFTGIEYFDETFRKKFNRFGRHMQRLMMNGIAKKIGCKGRLDEKVYRDN